jgi:cell surface protein SprA
LVNKLPNIDTDVRGEIAFLQPDTPKADQFQGESTIYVDDFEGSQSTIDMFTICLSSLHQIEMQVVLMILMDQLMI